MKHPRTVFRKLGRERADGVATDEGRKKYIEIDSRLKGRRLMWTFAHERMHFLFPDMPENEIDEKSEIIIDYLWKHGYRKIDNE